MHPRSLVLATCLLAVACSSASALSYTPDKDPESSQISPAVVLLSEADWKLSVTSDGQPSSRCLDMVRQAREYSNGDRLNFLPTHHWMPGTGSFGIASYCWISEDRPSGQRTCMEWTADKLAEFTQSMTLCFAEAFKQGFVVYVRPHLDDGLDKGIWRNGLLFSPLLKYAGLSYTDIMTVPLASAMRDALSQAAKTGTLYIPPEATRPVVYMSLQGDMSATLLRYTDDWMGVAPMIKSIIGNDVADVKVGAGLNYNALDAVESMVSSSSSVFGALLGGVTGLVDSSAPAIQTSNMQDLLTNQLDFLGVSAFAPFSGADFPTSQFLNSASSVSAALSQLVGVDVAQLASSGKLELHYSEWGLGGGFNGLEQVAASADACAQQPWAGITTALYNKLLDPWVQGYLAAFRSTFFTKAMQWLSSPLDAAFGATAGSSFRISQVFVWSLDSWDVFGIRPESSGADGTFRDLFIVRKIAAHNTAIIAAQICAFRSPQECSSYIQRNLACLTDLTGAACLIRNSTGSGGSTSPPANNESGPSQSTDPASGSQEQPAPSSPGVASSPQPAASSPAPSTGGQEAGPVNSTYLDMAPDATAASPAPAAASSVSSVSSVTKKNGAAGQQVAWMMLATAVGLVFLLV